MEALHEYKSISDYAVIGDMHSAALVGLDGSIDWCCFPRFDSPSVFAALLDSKKGGKFRLAPKEKHSTTQAYEEDTNILTTKFQTSGGSAKLTDFMPCFMQDGKLKTFSAIVRMLEPLEGRFTFRIDYQPRLNYGIGDTLLERTKSGGYAARNGASLLTMNPSIRLAKAIAGSLNDEFDIVTGEKAFFVVKYGKGRGSGRIEADVLEHELARTSAFWRSWARRIKYEGRWREQVVRSALVLKLLQYSPTGALVASVTTSLPETIGGERNWDYRYSWVRDAAFSLWALDGIGATREAIDYARWLVKARRHGRMPMLQIMDRIEGESDLDERTLDHLEGYRGSR
ncbi:MAG: DUF5911 domain-containing protein, partial [Thaumarchaeota archaeon]|nr:DUF5911 domain-containing protein [Nitrososphaerota archaeon]